MRNKKTTKSVTKDDFFGKLNFPQDVCTGALNVTLTGNREAWIENYKGILEYSEDRILLQCKNCRLSLTGNHLSIDYYTDTDMKIIGYISALQYPPFFQQLQVRPLH